MPASAARGAGGFDPNQFAGFEDIFGSLGDLFGFGDMFGGRRRRGGPQRGSDLRYDLEISFEESFTGTETSIQIPREETCETCAGSGAAAGSVAGNVRARAAGSGQLRFQQGFLTVARPCSNCRGTGKVISKPCQACRGAGRVGRERKITAKIPAGHRHRAAPAPLRRRGARHAPAVLPAISTSSSTCRSTPFFHREGDDLYCEMPVTLSHARARRRAPRADDDRRREVKVPAGTQPGARFKLRGKGMPNVSGRGPGDLYAIARVAVPKKLTREQKHLLEELAKTMPQEKLEAASGRRRREAVLRKGEGHFWLSTRRSRSSSATPDRPSFAIASTRCSTTSSPPPSTTTRRASTGACSSAPPTSAMPPAPALDGDRASSRPTPLDVPDEDWARRSQENLTRDQRRRADRSRRRGTSAATQVPTPVIIIEPSTGFGTGHHATTRLCLLLLQQLELRGARVLDIGTGSACSRSPRGSWAPRDVVAMDNDPDALDNARDEHRAQRRRRRDRHHPRRSRSRSRIQRADVVLANLTGAVLVRLRGWSCSSSSTDGGYLIAERLRARSRARGRASLVCGASPRA